MKKVLFINNVVYPIYDLLLGELSKSKDLDLHLWILSGEKNGSWGYRQKFPNTKYPFSIPININLNGERLGIFINPMLFLSLIRLSPDIVVIAGWDQPSYLAAFKYCKLFGKKIILWSSSTKGEKSLQRSLTLPYVIMISGGADRIVTLGQRSKDYLLSLGVREDKIIIGGYVSDFGGQEFPASLKSRRVKGEGKIIKFLYVGQLIYRKGLDLLIKAFGELDDENTELIVCGEGPMENELKGMVNSRWSRRIKFIGGKTGRELADLYSSSDVFVLPSRQEVWGLVVNEAMSFGLPVIVSDSAGCAPELVKEGKNGYLFKSGDYSDLKKKMSLLSMKKEKMSAMGRSSAENISKFTPSALASRFLDAFEVK